MLNVKNVMVLAPHADDETLGAGGTLSRMKRNGAALHWVLMTTPKGAGYPQDYIAAHTAQVEAVTTAYPFDGVYRMEYPASSLVSQGRAELVDRLRSLARTVRPELVLIPHVGDAHDDHAATAHAALAAYKGFRGTEFGIKSIYAMEILSETEAAITPDGAPFVGNTIVDISQDLDRKIELFALYETEIMTNGPRSPDAIRAQALLSGSVVRISAAERFMCLFQSV